MAGFDGQRRRQRLEISRDGSVLVTVSSTSYTDSAVSAGFGYTYSIVALDAAGNRSAPATTALGNSPATRHISASSNR